MEVAFAAALTGMLAAALGSMTLASRTAQDRLSRIEQCQSEASVIISRITRAVARCGTYQQSGSQTVLGLKAVDRSGYYTQWSSTLVCWTGGRDGDLSQLPPRGSRPVASELVVFTDSPPGSGRMCEVTFPGDSTSIDFRTLTDGQVRALVNGSTADVAPLSEKLRVYSDPSDMYYGGSQPKSGIFFRQAMQPRSSELTSTNWDNADWYLGQSDERGGLRHVQIDLELQFIAAIGNDESSASWPIFATFERAYRHEKP